MGGFLQKSAKKSPARSVGERSGGAKKNPDSETLQLSRLLKEHGLQAKLKVGKANDRYEQEADRVADRVMAAPAASNAASSLAGGITPLSLQRAEEEEAQPKILQRQEEEEEEAQPKLLQRQEEEEEAQPKYLQRQPQEEEEEAVQAKRSGAVTVPADLSNQVQALRGGGRPLPESERAFFEPRFGVDFSAVRVHEGGRAGEVARSINARAFTVGQDLVFGSGQYAPGSAAGRKLLAHELTHVVQQGGGRSGKLQSFSDVSRSAPSGTIQRRRLPKKSELAALINGSDAAAHRRGLIRLVKRSLRQLTAAQRTKVKAKARGRLSAAAFAALPDWQQKMKLAKALYESHPKLRHGDPKLYLIKPRKGTADAANIHTLVTNANLKFGKLILGYCDKDIAAVFGKRNVAAVKACYSKALQRLNYIDKRNKILSDRSGIADEVGLGGMTDAAMIMLSPYAIDHPNADESIITLVHESMHAGNKSIGDHCYISATATFTKQAEAIKLTNAAHYEVPLRREMKAAFAYTKPHQRVFIPAGATVGGVTAAALKPVEQGVGLATDSFRRAWDAGTDVHGIFRHVYLKPQIWTRYASSLYAGAVSGATMSGCLRYWSKVKKLTIHERTLIVVTGANLSRRPVTSIDLALAEGVCRKLSQARSALPQDPKKVQAMLRKWATVAQRNAVKGNGKAIGRLLQQLVLKQVTGKITGDLQRDLKVVKVLAAAYNGKDYKGILTPRNPASFP